MATDSDGLIPRILRPYTVIIDGDGATYGGHTYLRLIGPTITDNPAQGSTDVDFTGAWSASSLALSGDLSVGDDLTVTDDAAIGGDLAVTGAGTFSGLLTANGAIRAASYIDLATISAPSSPAAGFVRVRSDGFGLRIQTSAIGERPLGPLVYVDVTLIGGTRTVASGFDLSLAFVVSIILKTETTGTGIAKPELSGNNVVVTSYNEAVQDATDVRTYRVWIIGAK